MNINLLKKEYNKRKAEIKTRLKEFKQTKEHFYELCFCILTPQSNAYRCDECIKVLKKRDFLSNDFELNNILKGFTRFHNNKSRYLLKIKENKDEIFKALNSIEDTREKREYLVKHIKGLGMKEASHFLRNIGHENLAILDRHILKNLNKLGVIKNIPKSLTKKKYLEIEEKFKSFSKKIKLSMDELDLLFWSMQTGRVFK
jgi:N-glycosylase/DNA lyase